MKMFLMTLLLSLGCAAQQIPDATSQQQQLQNLVLNGGFENGRTKHQNSGGTFALSSANAIFGKQAAAFTASASGQYVESIQATIPKDLYGQNCMASLKYTGFDANMYLTVMNGSSTEIITTGQRVTFTNAAGTKEAKVYFLCPTSGSIKYRVVSTASSVIGYLDQIYIGKSDGFGSVGFIMSKAGGNNNGNAGVISFTTAVYDSLGGVSLSGGTYTIMEDGDYMFFVQNEWTAPQGVAWLVVVDGFSPYPYGNSTASSVYNGHHAYFPGLKKGQVAKVLSSTASIVNLSSFLFSGFKVK